MNIISDLPPLPPFPLADELDGLFAAPPEVGPSNSRDLYLDLAENIVSQAAEWVDDNGVVIDPVEGHDNRWRGGTAARFACPAAVLVRERQRTDLAPLACRALTQLARGILTWAAAGADFPAGVLDLTMKEIVVAYAILREHADPATVEVWRRALADFPADAAYTGAAKVAGGGRCTNYEASASVGEWLRFRHGLADERDWIERYLGFEMVHFTEFGLYRDPHDPMLYDLMVRQNLSELLHHGYHGPLRDRIEELLDRAGATTLLMLSPCGWAPFGGRSNALLHNEAMTAFICERQANREHARSRAHAAAAFKEAALRAARAAEPFAAQTPLRFIKNLFDPSTRHGKDANYGEYSNYALLAASLFARTALLTDDAIPTAASSPPSKGCVANLWPAFHKTFAAAGAAHVEIDTRCQPGYDATGLGRFHRAGAPPQLALPAPIAAAPKYIVHNAATDRAVAIGPCWRTAAGDWQSLAQMSDEIEQVEFERLDAPPGQVAWRLAWFLASGGARPNPVTSVRQEYRLAPDQLHIRAAATGLFTRFGFEIPCFTTAGGPEAETKISNTSLTVSYAGWVFAATVPDAASPTLAPEPRANRHALYRIARFETTRPAIEITLALRPATAPA